MKKIISIVLFLSLLLTAAVLVGCGGSEDESPTDLSSNESSIIDGETSEEGQLWVWNAYTIGNVRVSFGLLADDDITLLQDYYEFTDNEELVDDDAHVIIITTKFYDNQKR